MYKLGSKLNKKDLRDIPVSVFQPTVNIPLSYKTDISMIPVLNQGNLGSCVGHAHSIIHSYFEYLESKNIKNFSPRYLYALSKKVDNISTEGTSPRVTDNIMLNNGCALTDLVVNNTSLTHDLYINITSTPEIENEAKQYKIKGYTFVNNNSQSLMQSIYQNKLVTASIEVGDYNHAPMKSGNIGWHRIVIFGYEVIPNDIKFFFRNSWGEQWGDKGNGFFLWSDFHAKIMDLNTYVDIPNEVLKEYKAKYKYFKDSEVVGLKPEFVSLLDKARDISGVAFVITSGFRTPEQNKLVGGVEDSAHEAGLAVDLRVKDSVTGGKILLALTKVGFTRFGFYKDGHIHVDFDNIRPNPCYWIK